MSSVYILTYKHTIIVKLSDLLQTGHTYVNSMQIRNRTLPVPQNLPIMSL